MKRHFPLGKGAESQCGLRFFCLVGRPFNWVHHHTFLMGRIGVQGRLASVEVREAAFPSGGELGRNAATFVLSGWPAFQVSPQPNSIEERIGRHAGFKFRGRNSIDQ